MTNKETNKETSEETDIEKINYTQDSTKIRKNERSCIQNIVERNAVVDI